MIICVNPECGQPAPHWHEESDGGNNIHPLAPLDPGLPKKINLLAQLGEMEVGEVRDYYDRDGNKRGTVKRTS